MPDPATHSVARVLLDTPLPQLDHLFDYRIPDGLRGVVVPGIRVRVPLRRAGRIADGYVVETAEASDVPGELVEIEAVVSEQRVLTPEVYALARAVADRAAGSASDVLRLAIPRRQVRVEKAWRNGRRPEEPEGPPPVVELADYGDALPAEPGSRLAVEAIPGLVEVGGGWIGAWALTLARLAVHELGQGRSAVLVLPDYRDQDQVQLALASLPGAGPVLRLDARQSGPERYLGFLSALEERPSIVVGNRSAVYAPVHRLGLLAVWNDGDSLLGEQLAPYVHARDAALVRQEQSGCTLVLLGHARSAAAERLVELGWLTAIAPRRLRPPHVILTPDDPGSPRIPQAAWRAASEAVLQGPVLLQVARPGNAALDALRAGTPMAADAGRTAYDLGRAFPGVRVLISDGERPLERVDAQPALVIATRGAEPIADGGYRAVLLLDGQRMLMRESARVAEDCLRWWSAAASLAAPGAPVHLVGVGGPLGRAVATWRQSDFLAHEVAERRELRFPPAVRVATLTGPSRVLEPVLAEAEAAGATVVSSEPADGLVRTVVRFDYAHGAAVAGVLRTGILRAASGRRPQSVADRASSGRDRRPPPTLRVRMDDPDAL
ncbi:MAG: primosomal protein [Naasia sp.]|jgi:primosomal protein N' (replication factor Y)|uniref:primosomal protein N' family DNA-binding protein n=1 Tax=Naasia sp. TaxID=2546198 RepID=UPI0026218DD0|nr:primosomal protein N' [Naasia sp.]MCU1569867.1 primosomal protein [Naasia sp.]